MAGQNAGTAGTDRPKEETMTADEPIGHLVLRVPIFRVTESESWEIPQQYTYLAPGDAELVSHDIPASFHENLRQELTEVRYIEYGDWGSKELAETTRLHEHPMPAEPAQPSPEPLLFVAAPTQHLNPQGVR